MRGDRVLCVTLAKCGYAAAIKSQSGRTARCVGVYPIFDPNARARTLHYINIGERKWENAYAPTRRRAVRLWEWLGGRVGIFSDGYALGRRIRAYHNGSRLMIQILP